MTDELLQMLSANSHTSQTHGLCLEFEFSAGLWHLMGSMDLVTGSCFHLLFSSHPGPRDGVREPRDSILSMAHHPDHPVDYGIPGAG